MALVTDVGLAAFAHVAAVELPYGRKRALEIATTLALDPELLLLDEPMAGMGHEDIDRISALIKAVAAERTVLMVEHNLSVVANSGISAGVRSGIAPGQAVRAPRGVAVINPPQCAGDDLCARQSDRHYHRPAAGRARPGD